VASAVTISGTAEVGKTLTGNYTYADADGDLEGTSTFRWLRNDVAISGATSKTYVLVGADQGTTIKFEVTPVAATGVSPGAPVQSGGVGPVLPANTAPVASNVTISGTARVGQTLTGNYTYADADGDLEGTSTFRWLRNGSAIAGALAKTYVLVGADEGTTVRFEVTPVAQSGVSPGTPVQSAGVGPVTPANTAPWATDVTITGTPEVGKTLTGTYTYNDMDGDLEGTSTFRWLRNDVAIGGATANTYVLVGADQGALIKFEVTPVAQTGHLVGGAYKSAAVGPVVPANTAPVASNVTIAGSAVVGQTLTGNYTYTDADGDLEGTSTFRWLRNGSAVAGATAKTYTLVGADQGATIKFEVTPVAQAGASPGSPVQSAGVGPVLPANTAPVVSAVTITGTPKVGQTLTGSYTYTDADGDLEGTSTYRWLRNDVAIPGAAGKTYVVVSGDLAATIKFEVAPVAQTGISPGVPVQSAGVGIVTTVLEQAPIAFQLLQNYPNPFNPTTEIQFAVETTAHALLVVYNSAGQEVARLFDGVAHAGQYYVVRFDAAQLSSGAYICRLQTEGKTAVRKMLLVR
jgi:hypothetical protein